MDMRKGNSLYAKQFQKYFRLGTWIHRLLTARPWTCELKFCICKRTPKTIPPGHLGPETLVRTSTDMQNQIPRMQTHFKNTSGRVPGSLSCCPHFLTHAKTNFAYVNHLQKMSLWFPVPLKPFPRLQRHARTNPAWAKPFRKHFRLGTWVPRPLPAHPRTCKTRFRVCKLTSKTVLAGSLGP